MTEQDNRDRLSLIEEKIPKPPKLRTHEEVQVMGELLPEYRRNPFANAVDHMTKGDYDHAREYLDGVEIILNKFVNHEILSEQEVKTELETIESRKDYYRQIIDDDSQKRLLSANLRNQLITEYTTQLGSVAALGWLLGGEFDFVK